MQVGVNYPWFDYGWDFGDAPSGWRGQEPRWSNEIDRHLQHFDALGITVVRWFILADGLTYGTGGGAPWSDPISLRWRFEPSALSDSTVDHFEELLRRFGEFNTRAVRPILLLPVLIDFQFCQDGKHAILNPDPSDPARRISDPGWIKRGRADAITDPDKRAAFLSRVLDPLLDASRKHADVIYAWELINEPDWVTSGWHPDGRSDHPVDEASMRAFIDEGKDRIREAGFKPTIGFSLVETLRRSRITAEINQCHHYPGGRRRLARHRCDPRFPMIIGELATALTDMWPEHRGSQSIWNRLRLAERHGYPLALLWSFLQQDRHTAWSTDVEQQIQMFTGADREEG